MRNVFPRSLAFFEALNRASLDLDRLGVIDGIDRPGGGGGGIPGGGGGAPSWRNECFRMVPLLSCFPMIL